MISAKTCHQSQNVLLMIHLFSLLLTMLTYPDLSKGAQEIVFSGKTYKISQPKVNFNKSPVIQSTYQKHLGLYFDEKLNFSRC